MATSPGRWGARQLLSAWAAYWIGLGVVGVVALWPSLSAVARLSRTNAHGNVSVSVGDGTVAIKVTEALRPTVQQSASLLALALWFAGPPLLLWLVWLLARPDREPAPPASLGRGEPPLDEMRPRETEDVSGKR